MPHTAIKESSIGMLSAICSILSRWRRTYPPKLRHALFRRHNRVRRQGRRRPVLKMGWRRGYLAQSGSDWRGARLEHPTLEADPVAGPINEIARRAIGQHPALQRSPLFSVELLRHL